MAKRDLFPRARNQVLATRNTFPGFGVRVPRVPEQVPRCCETSSQGSETRSGGPDTRSQVSRYALPRLGNMFPESENTFPGLPEHCDDLRKQCDDVPKRVPRVRVQCPFGWGSRGFERRDWYALPDGRLLRVCAPYAKAARPFKELSRTTASRPHAIDSPIPSPYLRRPDPSRGSSTLSDHSRSRRAQFDRLPTRNIDSVPCEWCNP